MSSSGHPRSRKGKEVATASQKGPSSEGRKVKGDTMVNGGGKLVSYTTHLVIQFGGEWLVVSDARLTRVKLTSLAGRFEIGAKHVCEKVISLLHKCFTEVATMTRKTDLKAVADVVNGDFDGRYSDEYFCILDSQNKTTTGLVKMTPRKRRTGWIVENVKEVASSVIGSGSGSIKTIRSLATNRRQLQDLNVAHSYMKRALDKATESDPAIGGNYACNMSTKKGGWDYATLL